MIHLIMENKDNGKSCPISLEIDDKIYEYEKDKLFEKLAKYINYEIKVTYIGLEEGNNNYIIEEVLLDNTPTINLRRK